MVKRENYEETESDKKEDNELDYQEKNAKIEKEIRRLRGLFAKIDKKKKNLVFTTIDDVAFMTVTMRELREKIIREGTSIEYKTGKIRNE
mgnify:CR=1 FL=1